jgi:hypothetical protein
VREVLWSLLEAKRGEFEGGVLRAVREAERIYRLGV